MVNSLFSTGKYHELCKRCIYQKDGSKLELVEQTYNKHFPKRSFKKAIEKAMEAGILADYLDRKSREVINMLCAKYDYKMDIAVKQEEAFEDGKVEGAQQKAVEDAENLLRMKLGTPEQIAQATKLPLDQVLELKKQLKCEVTF